MPEKKYADLPAATEREGVDEMESSSHVPRIPSSSNVAAGERARRSHHRTTLSSAAVMRTLRSVLQMTDLMGPP